MCDCVGDFVEVCDCVIGYFECCDVGVDVCGYFGYLCVEEVVVD